MTDLLPLTELPESTCARLEGVLCDIDDTLTWKGRLVPEAFVGLQRLQEAGLKVVPVTGRPAGWVDHIARMWPVDGVVGENGGLWFWMQEGGMVRRFAQSEAERRVNRERLSDVGQLILAKVPGTALASDQPYRELDLAIDFCEDVEPLDEASIDAIVMHFRSAGATCKVSSIHVNGWYGSFDKLAGFRGLLADRWQARLEDVRDRWLYVGDSANDEPMFEYFAETSVGVANVRHFLDRMDHGPRFVTDRPGGHGFADLVDHLLAPRNNGSGRGVSLAP